MPKRKLTDIEIENKFVKKLPSLLKFLYLLMRFRTKELLIVILLIVLGVWFIFNFAYEGETITIQPSIKIEVKKKLN